MLTRLATLLAAVTILTFVGCPSQDASTESSTNVSTETGEDLSSSDETTTGAEPAEPKAVAVAVASCTDEDPTKAAQTATAQAIAKLGRPAKGLIFYEYFPILDAEGNDTNVPDTEKEKQVFPAVRTLAASIPVIGCRARSLVNDGTKLKNAVTVMAIGGDAVSCKVAKAELVTDRKAVGTALAAQLADVADLKLVMALSEMNLSFDTTEGVSVEDFIRGIVETVGEDVTLFGGNCFPNNYPDDKGGVQFVGDETLAGHVVAMGIGGPIAVHANHTNEFVPSEETVTVTKAEDKWVYEFDGRPATDVYREIRGMQPDDEFSNDWQHPIGVIVTDDKVYLRMVLAEDKEKKGLQFVAAVPEGTKVKILKGGDDPQAILKSAAEGIVESLDQAGDAEPLVALLSNCCARGGRLREFRQGDECEIQGAIMPAISDRTDVPIFGFYAWGELGPIAGPFGGLRCMYQQHTFVSAVLTEIE